MPRRRETVLEELLLSSETAMPLFSNWGSPYYCKVKSLDTILPRDTPVTRSFKDLIRQCLALDPNARIDPADALQHPFIVGQSPQAN